MEHFSKEAVFPSTRFLIRLVPDTTGKVPLGGIVLPEFLVSVLRTSDVERRAAVALYPLVEFGVAIPRFRLQSVLWLDAQQKCEKRWRVRVVLYQLATTCLFWCH